MKSRIKIFIFLLALFILPHFITAQASSQGYAGTGCSGFLSSSTIQQVAPWYCLQISSALSSYWMKWMPIALLAVFISFSIASILFGAGILLKNERIKNFGIGEYYEALASALIVVLFLTVTGVLFGLVPGLIVSTNPYVTSLNYIMNTITALQTELYRLFDIVAVESFYIGINLQVCRPLGCTYIPEPFKYTLQYLFFIPAFTMIDLQLDVLALLYTEFWAIMAFMYIAIPVFLIPGVVLRSLIPTRSMGGMMIAIAIGFYVALPLLFSVAYYFTGGTTLSQANYNTAQLQQYGSGTGAITNALNPNSQLVQTLNNIQVSMDAYWLSVIFYPALIMALTYAIILQIAEFIGGMSQLSSRLKI